MSRHERPVARRAIALVCAALVVPMTATLACAPLQQTPAYPTKNPTSEGHNYCSQLAHSAARRGSDLHGAGWGITVAGVGLVVGGVALPETGGPDNTKNKVAGPILVVGGVA